MKPPYGRKYGIKTTKGMIYTDYPKKIIFDKTRWVKIKDPNAIIDFDYILKVGKYKFYDIKNET